MVVTGRRLAAAGSVCGLQRRVRARLRQSVRADIQYGTAITTETVQNVEVNENRTNTWRSEWDGRGGPDGQKQEAAASCSTPGFGRSHAYQKAVSFWPFPT
jgi:hypothetical protein